MKYFASSIKDFEIIQELIHSVISFIITACPPKVASVISWISYFEAPAVGALDTNAKVKLLITSNKLQNYSGILQLIMIFLLQFHLNR